MVAKKYWNKSIIEMVDLIRREKENKFVKILDTSFVVFPEVFSPVYSSDTAWFAKKIAPLVLGKKILEIGAGSGVIACVAAIYGASTVVATDINPHAVNNVIANAKLHSLSIDARHGSMFEPILSNELFDIIFWNHPFYFFEESLKQDDVLSLSVYDAEYKFLEEFFVKGRSHLKNDGQLILGSSNVARIKLIKKFAQDSDYHMCLLEKTEVPIYKNKKINMDLRIYSFNPITCVTQS